jgi:hypothetical protein
MNFELALILSEIGLECWENYQFPRTGEKQKRQKNEKIINCKTHKIKWFTLKGYVHCVAAKFHYFWETVQREASNAHTKTLLHKRLFKEPQLGRKNIRG